MIGVRVFNHRYALPRVCKCPWVTLQQGAVPIRLERKYAVPYKFRDHYLLGVNV